MNAIEQIIKKHQAEFHPVVEFNSATDKLFQFNFTVANSALTDSDIAETSRFSNYINDKLESSGSRYGIGGYAENRILYRRSGLFEGEEVRCIHLGIDIWGPAGTAVYAPIGGMVHSYASNNDFGDYGATIILQHQLETLVFHTLYGHLSLADLSEMTHGKYINRGELIGHFGKPEENGDWPPHLHLQIIEDMHEKKGDYPGVCKIAESEMYLNNCPDTDLILNMMKYIHPPG